MLRPSDLSLTTLLLDEGQASKGRGAIFTALKWPSGIDGHLQGASGRLMCRALTIIVDLSLESDPGAPKGRVAGAAGTSCLPRDLLKLPSRLRTNSRLSRNLSINHRKQFGRSGLRIRALATAGNTLGTPPRCLREKSWLIFARTRLRWWA
jgi:hypothetical protein